MRALVAHLWRTVPWRRWVGMRPDKLYKFINGSHIEQPCNEVPAGEELHSVRAKLMDAAAR